jgi:hypothetical protein
MDNRFVDAILAEVSKEKADSLGRAGNSLEAALHELSNFDAHRDTTDSREQEHRRRLVWRIARLVTNFIVQREACGLRDPEYVFEFYRVPQEVIAQLGKRATLLSELTDRAK